MKTITVYGSAQIRPGDADYEASVIVGRKLAEAGYAVMTGGYYGVMEAISKGANEAGGHVIGVTTDQIGKRYNHEPNVYINEIVNYTQLRDRLLYMVQQADGYLAMPGGVGTLHEIAETWELMRIDGIPTRPFVCYGSLWETVIHALQSSPYLGEGYKGMLSIVHTPDKVVASLNV
jgi:uncharacterized protein (TIGR00730 family)